MRDSLAPGSRKEMDTEHSLTAKLQWMVFPHRERGLRVQEVGPEGVESWPREGGDAGR